MGKAEFGHLEVPQELLDLEGKLREMAEVVVVVAVLLLLLVGEEEEGEPPAHAPSCPLVIRNPTSTTGQTQWS